ncbi:MAG: hypothetical protein SCARUB_05237 [Candidatus Scalindua rubra]|uniref:Phage-Barnase-EndoU-ColicinE5/D-RelE like nuclease 3 domain-containing protein n=1 Tax=Candidatus Scalindua rubra TaxID=1872076 RepID=A0A1E3X261_9BACT|nr:MAG: hypothetical protein SCARUB_05237 [Candidatus Scalindua rubra]
MAGYYDEILGIVEYPNHVIKGYEGALIALGKAEKERFIAVVYKEINGDDGFIITAYFTSKVKLEREVILWQRQE